MSAHVLGCHSREGVVLTTQVEAMGAAKPLQLTGQPRSEGLSGPHVSGAEAARRRHSHVKALGADG